MILSLKSLATAGLVASMATGGTLAIRVQSDSHPLAATAETATTTASAPAADSPAPSDDNLRPDDGHETTVSTSPDRGTTTTTTAPLPAPAPAVSSESAGDAGTVDLSIANGFLTIAAVHPNAGWTVDRQRAEGHEAQVKFSDGARRIEFKAELEDGRLATHVVDHTVGAQPAAPAVTGEPGTEAGDDHDATEQEQGQEQEQEHEDSAVAPAPAAGTTQAVGSGSGRDGGDHSGSGGGGGDHSGDSH